MLAELFWPKEMKELVAKYRSQGTLNEEAVRHNNKQFLTVWVIGILLTSLLVFTELSAIYYAPIIAAIGGVAVYDSRYSIKKYIIPYTFGEKNKARLVFIRRETISGLSSIFRFLLCYHLNGKNKTVKNITKEQKEYLESQGSEFKVVINPKDEKYHMVYFPEWERKYNLTYKEDK